MPTETIHFRVEYSNGAIYHIIASTNVDQTSDWKKYFKQEYVSNNGLASLVMSSEKAKKPSESEKNFFYPDGDAHDAASELIKKLNQLNNEAKPMYLMEY